jgi:hypothetical protein
MISRFLQFVSVSFFCVVILCTLCTVRSGDTHLVQRSFVYKEDALPSLSESLVPTKTSFAAKREASTWAKAVETGLGLLCKLKQKDEDGKLASQFTTLEQFNQYWTDPGYAEEGDLTTTGEDIQPALDALNLPSKLGERGLTGIQCMQSEEWFVNGVRNNVSKMSLLASANFPWVPINPLA